MALFGFNVVLTMIVASVIHKLGPHYSFGRWFLTRGLHYYTVPVDSILISHVATHNSETSKKIPKSLPLDSSLYLKRIGPIPLTPMPINYAVILLTFYYKECKWILDLFMAVLFVTLVTFVVYIFNPVWHCSQVNMSSVWIGFIFMYTLIQLYKLSTVYLSSELPKERITLVVLSLFLFVCILAFLPLDGSVFDFKLYLGYIDFINGLLITLTPAVINNTNIHTIDRATVESYVPFKLYLLMIVSIGTYVGFVLVFPVLNYTKLHFETVNDSKGLVLRTLLHINYIFPLVTLTLWFRTIAWNDEALPPNAIPVNPVYRFLLVIVLCCLRLSLFQLHMKTYLARAKDSLNNLRSTKPRVTVGDFKLKVKSIFSFYGGASLQYFGPVIFLTTIQLLYLISSSYLDILDCSQFHKMRDARGVFYLSVYRYPLSFLTWWVLFVLFFVSSAGSLIDAAI
ncbi:PREDICTED: transmembrane protein 161B-like [Amphimedon queenslandica]|uniref:Transmembrane protein n=1 Tax=Amphimedon queenslandica TaxID=400682 RepID=A0A1X7UX40_AMPQE|nr:PREDICTED: transmembrane protein 161B-like [Amphimedon queenslandica]|eukprot:XP_011403943.1 PREDICTED: transmembrane protein 161B-like [Amphimedon queenslandica]